MALRSKVSKVSASGLAFYRDYLDYFFDSPDLSFRALIVSNKRKLRHEDFQQSHDDWYYKMFYQALKPLISTENTYCIYLDRKDTLSQYKVEHLRNVLSNQLHDFRQEIITRVQQVRSDEIEQVQLVDLLIGAVGYHNRRQGWRKALPCDSVPNPIRAEKGKAPKAVRAIHAGPKAIKNATALGWPKTVP